MPFFDNQLIDSGHNNFVITNNLLSQIVFGMIPKEMALNGTWYGDSADFRESGDIGKMFSHYLKLNLKGSVEYGVVLDDTSGGDLAAVIPIFDDPRTSQCAAAMFVSKDGGSLLFLPFASRGFDTSNIGLLLASIDKEVLTREMLNALKEKKESKDIKTVEAEGEGTSDVVEIYMDSDGAAVMIKIDGRKTQISGRKSLISDVLCLLKDKGRIEKKSFSGKISDFKKAMEENVGKRNIHKVFGDDLHNIWLADGVKFL